MKVSSGAATSPFTQDRTDAGRGGRDETRARTRPHEGTRENANTPSSSVTVSHGTPGTRTHGQPSVNNVLTVRRLPRAACPRRRALPLVN